MARSGNATTGIVRGAAEPASGDLAAQQRELLGVSAAPPGDWPLSGPLDPESVEPTEEELRALEPSDDELRALRER